MSGADLSALARLKARAPRCTPPLLYRSGLRHHLRQPLQLALAILGIALGVAVVLAVDLANESARASFRQSVERVIGTTTHRIYGGADGVPEGVYVELRRQRPGLVAAPVVTGYGVASTPAQPEMALTVQLLGLDPFAEVAFRRLASAPIATVAEGANLDLDGLLTRSHSALFPPDLSDHREVVVSLAGQSHTLTAAGQLSDPSAQGLLVIDISTAQELFDRRGFLSHIDLIIPPERAATEVAALQQWLPAGLTIEPAEERDNATAELTAAFSLNLTAMSLLALAVGLFLIYNAISFTVVQRRDLLGRLRVLGVSSREIFRLILFEALVIGLVGTLIGLALGLALATVMVELVLQTIDDLYFKLPLNRFALTPWSLAKGIALGLLATLLGALLPAYEATTVPPRASLGRASIELRWRRGLRRLSLLAGAIFAAGSLLLWQSQGLWPAFIGLFGVLLGCALLTPALVDAVARLLGALAARYSRWLAMALRDVSRHLSRTGIAAAALTIAFAATVGVGVLVDSFRSGLIIWLDDLLNADIYLAPQSATGSGQSPPLDQRVLDRLATLDGVASFSSFYHEFVLVEGSRTSLVVADLPLQARAGYRFTQGEAAAAWRGFDRGEVLVSEPFAYHRGKTVGDQIELLTSAGAQPFTIAGVFHDYASEHGRIFISRHADQLVQGQLPVESVALYAQPGSDLTDLRQRISAELTPIQPLILRSNRDIFNLSLEIFDRTFTVTQVLRLLAIAIAVVGMMSALLALQLERAREHAVLRAMGMTPFEVGRLVVVETTLLGLVAGLLAIPVGLALAAGLIYVIHRRSFGWTMPFEIDPALLAQGVGLALLAALLAGIYPILRSAFTPPANALREE